MIYLHTRLKSDDNMPITTSSQYAFGVIVNTKCGQNDDFICQNIQKIQFTVLQHTSSCTSATARSNSGDHFQSTPKFIRHILFELFRIFKLSPLQQIFVFRNEKVLVQLYLEIKEVTEAVQCCNRQNTDDDYNTRIKSTTDPYSERPWLGAAWDHSEPLGVAW